MSEPLNLLRGTGVALVTPFKNERSIDYVSLHKLLNHVIDGGADYLVVLGTTAETPTLSEDEKESIRNYIAEKVAGRVPLILGLGSNNTYNLCEQLCRDNFNGYNAILSVVPYYNKPSQEGIYQHFSAVADSSPLPVVLYNVPGRTGVDMSDTTILKLAHDFKGKIIGIKEASGKVEKTEVIMKDKPEGFDVVSGDDGLTLPLMKLGASGVISVFGNAFPDYLSRMVSLCLVSNFEKAALFHDNMMEMVRLIFEDGNPAGIKCVLSQLGLGHNVLRLPLVPTCEETERKISEALSRIKEFK